MTQNAKMPSLNNILKKLLRSEAGEVTIPRKKLSNNLFKRNRIILRWTEMVKTLKEETTLLTIVSFYYELVI